MDELRQSLAAPIRLEPDAQPELEGEAIGRAVDQADPWHADLRPRGSPNALYGAVLADPEGRAVREARDLGVREAVLVHRRQQAIDGAAADLQHCVIVTSERIRHVIRLCGRARGHIPRWCRRYPRVWAGVKTSLGPRGSGLLRGPLRPARQGRRPRTRAEGLSGRLEPSPGGPRQVPRLGDDLAWLGRGLAA